MDNDYNVVKQCLQGNASINFDTCVKRIRSREQDLSTEKKQEEKGCARRFVKKGGNFSPNKNDGGRRRSDLPDGKILMVHGFILYKINPDNIRKDLIRWQGIFNNEKRTIRINELQRISKPKSGNNSETKTDISQDPLKPRQKPAINQNKNIQIKTVRKTSVKNSGMASQTIGVSMKDEDDGSKTDESNGSISSKEEDAPPQDNTSRI